MIKIFIDFDGTITKGDLGDNLFYYFGGPVCTKIIEDYRSGLISAADCFTREAKACGNVSQKDVSDFIDKQEIDTSFIKFTRFCREKNSDPHQIKLYILSDGLDYYIERVLQNYGISDIPFFANKLEFVKTGMKITFPYSDEDCDRCANCKRNHMLTLSGDDDIIVYIGDGYSDKCAVKYADIVFARGELQTFCQKDNISYYLFNSFEDVITRMEEILKKKRIRKRQQAEFNRKEVYLAG